MFSVANVFYRDIQHFSNILFFIWMFLTPVAYPYYMVGGGLDGLPVNGIGVIKKAKMIHLFGHVVSLGTIFKLNPMTDAVLAFQSFLYSGSLPSSTYIVKFGPKVVGHPRVQMPITSNVSWFDFGYFAAWAIVMFIVGLWVFRKYEARLPEEL
jgi:ABC-type polysaccharide/polyol phosphate export permease